MQARRGFFQTMLAAAAGALTKTRAAALVPRSPWREVPTVSVFMRVRRDPARLEYFTQAEPGFAIGHTADLARVDFA